MSDAHKQLEKSVNEELDIVQPYFETMLDPSYPLQADEKKFLKTQTYVSPGAYPLGLASWYGISKALQLKKVVASSRWSKVVAIPPACLVMAVLSSLLNRPSVIPFIAMPQFPAAASLRQKLASERGNNSYLLWLHQRALLRNKFTDHEAAQTGSSPTQVIDSVLGQPDSMFVKFTTKFVIPVPVYDSLLKQRERQSDELQLEADVDSETRQL